MSCAAVAHARVPWPRLPEQSRAPRQARPTNTPTMTPTDLPTIAPREHVACAAGSPCAKCMATGNTATQCASYGVECACAQPPKHVACAAGSACTRCMASGNTAKQCTSYGLDCACARGVAPPIDFVTTPPPPTHTHTTTMVYIIFQA